MYGYFFDLHALHIISFFNFTLYFPFLFFLFTLCFVYNKEKSRVKKLCSIRHRIQTYVYSQTFLNLISFTLYPAHNISNIVLTDTPSPTFCRIVWRTACWVAEFNAGLFENINKSIDSFPRVGIKLTTAL